MDFPADVWLDLVVAGRTSRAVVVVMARVAARTASAVPQVATMARAGVMMAPVNGQEKTFLAAVSWPAIEKVCLLETTNTVRVIVRNPVAAAEQVGAAGLEIVTVKANVTTVKDQVTAICCPA